MSHNKVTCKPEAADSDVQYTECMRDVVDRNSMCCQCKLSYPISMADTVSAAIALHGLSYYILRTACTVKSTFTASGYVLQPCKLRSLFLVC